jgi:magnesium transporter
MTTNPILYGELHRTWSDASSEERMSRFKGLPLADAQEFFRELSTRHQYEIISSLPEGEQTVWLRILDPDDAADLVQETTEADQERLLHLLDENTKDDVRALLKYREDVAGGLMSPRFARLRPNMTVSEALTYVRKQALSATETVYTAYVLDAEQDDQEKLSRLIAEHDLIATPIVDSQNHMKGTVTIDDIVDVVQEEATEAIWRNVNAESNRVASALKIMRLAPSCFSLLLMGGHRALFLCLTFLSRTNPRLSDVFGS